MWELRVSRKAGDVNHFDDELLVLLQVLTEVSIFEHKILWRSVSGLFDLLSGGRLLFE